MLATVHTRARVFAEVCRFAASSQRGEQTPRTRTPSRSAASGPDVQVVLDSALLALDQLGFHPLDNSMTTTVSPDGLIRFLESVDHPPTIIEFPYA